MKTLKKLFGIKTTYAIPSNHGLDITKGKKYEFHRINGTFGYIKDDSKVKIYITGLMCKHINDGNWQIIIE